MKETINKNIKAMTKKPKLSKEAKAIMKEIKLMSDNTAQIIKEQNISFWLSGFAYGLKMSEKRLCLKSQKIKKF